LRKTEDGEGKKAEAGEEEKRQGRRGGRGHWQLAKMGRHQHLNPWNLNAL
jgi:hypothetical protein